MKVLSSWVKQAKVYPPAEIFFEKYGKDAKAEERIKQICEDVYRLCFPDGVKNPLADLGASYRDFEVAHLVGFEHMKPEYINKIKDALLADVKFAITSLDALFKKDQLLQQYYSSWKVKFSEINSELYDMTKDYV